MFSKINYVDEVKRLAAVKLEFLQTCVAIGALDFHEHFKMKISKIDPAVLEF